MALPAVVPVDERGVHFRRIVLAAMTVAGVALAPAAPAQQGRTLDVSRITFNRLANSAFVSGTTLESVPLPQWLVVADATNAMPIVVRTPIPHGLSNGEEVLIKGVRGNDAANGWWSVTVTGPNTFSLDGSIPSGAWTGGGAVFPAAGQPAPPGSGNDLGELGWTPWFAGPAAFEPTEFFRSDGAQPTGEISSYPIVIVDSEPVLVTSFLAQEIDGSLFRPNQPLCLAIDARITGRPAGNQQFTMLVTAAFATTTVYRATFPATFLTADYRRLAHCFTLGPGAIPQDSVLRVQFLNEMASRGPAERMEWARPMLNEGIEPAAWTAAVEPRPRTVGRR